MSTYVIRCQWKCNDSAVLRWCCFAADGCTEDQCIGITARVRTLPTYGISTWTYPILCNEVRIENSITLTSSAFYPIRILPNPHFTRSAFYPILILHKPHFTKSAFYQIRILPNPYFSVYPTAFYRIPNPYFTVYPNERIINFCIPELYLFSFARVNQ